MVNTVKYWAKKEKEQKYLGKWNYYNWAQREKKI